MKTNMGIVDRSLRIAAAVVVGALYFAGILSGLVAGILLLIAGIFIITAFWGFCPIYAPFHFSTKKENLKNQENSI